jgi:hypothetical protein
LSYLRCPGHKRTVHPLMLQGLQRGAPPPGSKRRIQCCEPFFGFLGRLQVFLRRRKQLVAEPRLRSANCPQNMVERRSRAFSELAVCVWLATFVFNTLNRVTVVFAP